MRSRTQSGLRLRVTTLFDHEALPVFRSREHLCGE
jgi:hypothetical protein